MSLQEFWEDNPQNFFIYEDTYLETTKNQDHFNWLQGKYNLLAFEQVMNNAFSKTSKQIYPNEAFFVSEENNNLSLKDKMLKMISRVSAKFDKGE